MKVITPLVIIFFLSIGTVYFSAGLKEKNPISWEQYSEPSYRNNSLISERLVQLEVELEKIKEGKPEISILDILKEEETPQAFRSQIEGEFDKELLLEKIKESLFKTIMFKHVLNTYTDLPREDLILRFDHLIKAGTSDILTATKQELEQYP